jgi:hypothetical protein
MATHDELVGVEHELIGIVQLGIIEVELAGDVGASETDSAFNFEFLTAVHVPADENPVGLQRGPVRVGQHGTAEADLTTDSGRHQADFTVSDKTILTIQMAADNEMVGP